MIENRKNGQEGNALELTRRLVESQSKGIPEVYRQITQSNITINKLIEKDKKKTRNEFCVHLKFVR